MSDLGLAGATALASTKLRMLPFSSELSEFGEDHIVSVSGAGDNAQLRWDHFRQRVQQWDKTLESVAEPTVALFHSASDELLVMIVAAWRAGKTVVLPPNKLDATMGIVAKETSVFLGDFGSRCFNVNPSGYDRSVSDSKTPLRNSVGAESIAFVLYTSGSSGEPSRVEKTFAQINAEALLLERHFGESLGDALTVATVPHNHLFGLTFKLMWPLLAGRAFLEREIPYLESIPELPSQYQLALICSPPHLENIPSTVSWDEPSRRIRAVFTAGSALSSLAADSVLHHFGRDPTEIYGSTETGVIAWRLQQRDTSWRVFDGIECDVVIGDGNNEGDIEQLLRVRSPALPDERWLVTADRAKIVSEGCFELKGRADKIVKLGGKRISLSQVERLLSNHPWIKSVRVLPHATRTARLCAVVVLHGPGNAYLIDRGAKQTQQHLCEVFDQEIEKIAYPRYWRFVDALPINNNGKTTFQELAPLFRKNATAVRDPLVLSITPVRDALEYNVELRVPANLLYLEGHFPGRAILPGVVQLAWVVEKGTELFGDLGKFSKLEAVKFQQIIHPEQNLTLVLVWEPERNVLSFRYESDDKKLSSGRIVFGGGAQ